MITHRNLRPGVRVTLCGLSSSRLHRTDQDEEVTCRRCQLLIAQQPSRSELARELALTARATPHPVTCSECGRVFDAYRPSTTTCSATCRSQRRHRLSGRRTSPSLS